MAPFQRTRKALSKKQKVIKNKEKIVISDEEVSEEKAPNGWSAGYGISNYKGSYYGEPSQDPSKTYCEFCTNEIKAGKKYCEMCALICSCKNDYELFGYDL